MKALSRVEPLFWILFGAGAMVAAMLLPAFFFVVAIGFPLGWFGTPAETFERMRFLLGNPVSRAVIGVCVSLIFWHSAHHVRHFAYDLGLHGAPVALSFYGLALLGTLLALRVAGGL